MEIQYNQGGFEMIPQKYKTGMDMKTKHDGIDIITWLEDHEDRLIRIESKLQSLGRILNSFNGLALLQGNKKVEVSFYEDNKPLSERVQDIKDPEKEILKVHEFMEFVIYNLIGGVGPDGKKMDTNKKKQIFKNALKKIEEEENKEEKVPQTPPKEEKKQ